MLRKILLSIIITFLITILPLNAQATSFKNSGTGSFIDVRNGVPIILSSDCSYIRYWTGSAWVSNLVSYYSYNQSSYAKRPFDGVEEIVIDNQNRLWFSGTESNKYSEYTTGYIDMQGRTGQADLRLYSEFFKDRRTGLIYVVETYTGRVGYLNGNNVSFITTNTPENSGSTESLAVDNNGTIWVGGAHDIYYWNGSQWIKVTTPLPYCNWTNVRVEATVNGTIFTQINMNSTKGWASYKDGVWKNHNGELPFTSHLAIKNSPDGKIWGIGAQNQRCLAYFDENSDSIVQTIPWEYNITDFAVDDNGTVWVIGSNYCAAYIEGSWITDTDSFSPKLMEAILKAANGAKVSADSANINASSSKNMLNGSSNGGKSLAATYDKANSANTNTAYIRNTQLPDLQNKINSMETTITNINNSILNTDTIPPTVDVQTESGARATSATSIKAIVTATDNKPGPFSYSINGSVYATLPADGRVDLPVTSAGNNTITVKVKDAVGNEGSKTIVIRKL